MYVLWACVDNLVPELDMEGTVTPDDDLSQDMGDPSLEITEDMRDQANEKRTEGSIALADGMCLQNRLTSN